MAIQISVTNKIAAVKGTPVIVCGNSDYSVQFAFDGEWGAGTYKTARFVYIQDGEVKHQDVDFTGDTVNVPALYNTREVRVGVFEGEIHTSTPAVIPCKPSVICGSGAPAIPTPEQDARIMELLNLAIEQQASAEAAAVAAANSALDAQDAANQAPPIVETANGEVIAIGDSASRPLRGLTLYGKTTQNGTPSPDSPAELVSAGSGGSIGVTVAGKNLFQVSKPYNKDGSFSITAGETAVAGIYKNLTGTIPAGTYTVSYLNGYGVLYVMLSENDYTSPIKVGDFKTFAYDGVSFLRLVSDNVPANTTKTYKIQLECGATATEFEPHKTKQLLTAATPNGLPGIPVTSGGNCTDENGQQWLSDVRDYGQGVYVENVPCVTLSELSYTADSTPGLFHAGLPHPAISTGYDEALAPYLMCNTLPAVTRRACTAGTQGVTLSGAYIYVCVPGCTTTAELQTWFASHPTQAVYRAATPTETPLPAEELAAYAALHSNKPTTTVYSDAGAGLAVDYVADTKNYIDQKLAAISAALLNV